MSTSSIGPLTPIYAERKRRGSIDIGNTPPAETAPRVLSTLTSSQLNGASWIELIDDYCFIAAFDADLFVSVNVSNRYAPYIASALSHASFDEISTMARSGTLCFPMQAAGTGIVSVVDVSSPASPSRLGGVTMAVTVAPRLGVVIGTNLFITGSTDRIVTVDFSTPATPSITGTFTDTTYADNPVGIARTGNNLFVASVDDQAITTVSATVPTVLSGVAAFSGGGNLASPRDLIYDSGFLYANALGPDRLIVLDASTPASLSLAAAYGVPDIAAGMVKHGNYIFACTGSPNPGFAAINVANPMSPQLVYSFTDAVFSTPRHLAVDDNFVYVVDLVNDRLIICSRGGI